MVDDYLSPERDAGYLHAMVSFAPGGSGGVGRAWLRGGAERLLGNLVELEAKTVGVAGRVMVAPRASDPLRSQPFSRRGWDAAVEAAGAEPEYVSVGLFSRRPEAVYTSLSVCVTASRLGADATRGPGFDPAVHAERWVGLLGDVLDTADPAYAQISDRVGSQFNTALDMFLRRSRVSVAESRTSLRGYAWVTVVPKELVERLGGAAALARSKAVVLARPLAAGGVLLQATPTPAEFDSAAMRRLFRLLAPVLPAGRPRPLPGWEGLPVVLEDAARR
ncbi:type VI immunity family protein [Asanoa sp. NPDC050611]|uniref:type VI immunity family protein n=1 Tax=Asanoa sp. NPDC050611 TaxID=3157098 RepID=UPI0033FAB4BB